MKHRPWFTRLMAAHRRRRKTKWLRFCGIDYGFTPDRVVYLTPYGKVMVYDGVGAPRLVNEFAPRFP